MTSRPLPEREWIELSELRALALSRYAEKEPEKVEQAILVASFEGQIALWGLLRRCGKGIFQTEPENSTFPPYMEFRWREGPIDVRAIDVDWDNSSITAKGLHGAPEMVTTVANVRVKRTDFERWARFEITPPAKPASDHAMAAISAQIKNEAIYSALGGRRTYGATELGNRTEISNQIENEWIDRTLPPRGTSAEQKKATRPTRPKKERGKKPVIQQAMRDLGWGVDKPDHMNYGEAARKVGEHLKSTGSPMVFSDRVFRQACGKA